MTIKTTLKIVLHAGETIVAESENAKLWQDVLIAINSSETAEGSSSNSVGLPQSSDLPTGSKPKSSTSSTDDNPIAKFASEVGVDEAVLTGACGPSIEAPFIHLDKHHYEALKKNTPVRGRGSVSDAALAATLLIFWKKSAGLDNVSDDEISPVLKTVDVTSSNSQRAIRNCEWLQKRGSSIVLNPAKTSQAISVIKGYCLKKEIDSEEK
ncbi:MAG: hypothetical protein CME32_06345 [Gimesia sp.]|nr:hypothetical protein [Gimesia sp.]